MEVNTLNQRNALNLLRNGSFSQGVAHWWGSYLRHKRSSGGQTLGSNAPEYALEVFQAQDTSYPDSVTPGAHQWVDRPDLFTYPSQRLVSGLRLIPFTDDRALLQVVPELTAMDGVVLAEPDAAEIPTYSDIFQHPFVHLEPDGTRVNIEAGSVLPLTDTRRPESSGLYRVGSFLENRNGTGVASDYDPSNYHEYTYHGLEINPLSGGSYKALMTHETSGVVTAAITAEASGLYTVVTISVDKDVVRGLDREQPGYTPELGLAVGDVFTMTEPVLRSGVITQVAISDDQTVVTLIPLANYGDYVVTPFVEDVTPEAWSIYATSVATVRRTMPLYAYDFTLGYTCRINDGYSAPAETSMVARTLSGTGTLVGTGTVGAEIPRIGGKRKIVNLLIDEDTVDGAWQRRLERHFREASAPLEGRIDLSVLPPAGSEDSYPTPTSKLPDSVYWYFFTDLDGELPNLNDPPESIEDTPHFQINIPVDENNLPPAEWLAGNKEFTVTPFGDTSELEEQFSWIIPLLLVPSFTAQAALLEVPDETYPALLKLYVAWDTDEFGAFPSVDGFNIGWNSTVTATWGFNVKGLNGSGARALVSDVFMTHGDQAQRLEKLDDTALPVTGPLTDDVSIDPLRHGVDLLENVIPPGAVVLYAGGGTCPPGFKRVESFPDAAVAGIGSDADLTLTDATVVYDTARDRTKITWTGREFPLYDDDGGVIPIPELALSVSKPIPGIPDSLQEVKFTPSQQVVQPGMAVRVPEFLMDSTITETDPLFSSETLGKAMRAVGGWAQLHRPEEPLFSRLGVELWFQTQSSITTSGDERLSWIFRQAKKVGDDVISWGLLYVTSGTDGGKLEWRVETVGSLGARTDVYRMTTAALPVSGFAGDWMHIIVEFSAPNSGTVGEPGQGVTPDVRITFSDTEDSYGTLIESHNFGVVQAGADLAKGAVLRLGHTPEVDGALGTSSYTDPVTGNLITLAAKHIDNFRVFDLSSQEMTESERVALWNSGKGLALAPAELQSRLVTEVRFDEGYGSTAVDSAPVNWTEPVQLQGAASWTTGHVLALGGSDFGTDDYRAPFEDKARSYLVTKVESILVEAEGAFASGIPYNPSANPVGNGLGDVLYPFSVSEDDLMEGDKTIMPLGPGLTGQSATFDGGAVLSGQFWNGTSSGGLFSTITMRNFGSQPSDWNPQVGDVYFLQWESSDNPGLALGWFPARLTDITIETGIPVYRYYTFQRYDGRKIQLTPAEYQQLSYEDALSGDKGTITVRPVKLFGDGEQVVASETGAITPQAVTISETFYNSTRYWVVRRLSNNLELEVKGDLSIPTGQTEIHVEATGYLRYDDPEDKMDYGAGGHSHRVGGALTATDDLIPRISETGSLASEPYQAVAQDHDHGFQSVFRFPLPKFRLFTACQKL